MERRPCQLTESTVPVSIGVPQKPYNLIRTSARTSLGFRACGVYKTYGSGNFSVRSLSGEGRAGYKHQNPYPGFSNVNVALKKPPQKKKIVLVRGVWRGRKKRVGANNADSGGLGGGGGLAVRVCCAWSRRVLLALCSTFCSVGPTCSVCWSVVLLCCHGPSLCGLLALSGYLFWLCVRVGRGGGLKIRI